MRHPAKLTQLAVVAVSALALAAAGQTVKEAMKSVVEPTTNVLFAVAGEADPANGADAAKVTPSRWQEAADAAVRLKASAAALMAPDQSKPGETWAKDAKQLHDLAEAAEAAALARDGAKLSDTANALGDNCTACHSQYKDQTAR
jgi:cytochrome c556